jgi:hypothetical protein
MIPARRVLLELLRRVRGVDRARLATAATVLLLDPDDELSMSAIVAIDSGRCRMDGRLFSQLYAGLPARLQIALACSHAMSRLDPKTFDAIFTSVYRKKMRVLERRTLASRLWHFLDRNPSASPKFKNAIEGLMRSKESELRIQGLQLAGKLRHLEPPDLERLRAHLQSKRPFERIAAAGAFAELLRRWKQVEPVVMSFSTAPETVTVLERMRDKDTEPDARLCARYFFGALRSWQRAQRHKKRNR